MLYLCRFDCLLPLAKTFSKFDFVLIFYFRRSLPFLRNMTGEQSGAHIGIGQIKFQFCRGFCVFRLDNSSLERTIMFGNSSWNSCLYHVIPCDRLLITRLFYYRRKRSLCFPNTFFLTIPTGKDYTIRSFVASVEDVYKMFYCVVPSADFHPSEIWYFLHHKSN